MAERLRFLCLAVAIVLSLAGCGGGGGGGILPPGTVSVRGRMLEDGTGRAVPGAVIVFWNSAGVEVGRTVSGPTGRWDALLPTSATHMFLEFVPPGYYKTWRYGTGIYDINYGPATCKASIERPTQGKDYGGIYLYPESGGPPPPPNCG